MIGIVYPDVNNNPVNPKTIGSHEVHSYDFSECSENIFKIFNSLKCFNLIKRVPFKNSKAVLSTILSLVDDIDIEVSDFQQEEQNYIRVVYVDYMLAVEVTIGV